MPTDPGPQPQQQPVWVYIDKAAQREVDDEKLREIREEWNPCP